MSKQRPSLPLTPSAKSTERKLYIWLDGDPFSGPPDLAIDDIPGRADLDLLAEAIRAGRLGRYLATQLAISPHQQPKLPSSVRHIHVANLLRQYRIPYRSRLEVLLDSLPEHQTTYDRAELDDVSHSQGT